MKNIFILTIILLTSCKTADFTTEKISLCPLHDVKLKKAIVRTNYGRVVTRPKPNLYPYPKMTKEMGCILPDTIKRHAKIYTCRQCTKAYKKFKADIEAKIELGATGNH